MHCSEPIFIIGSENTHLSFTLQERPGHKPYQFGKFLVSVKADSFSGKAYCYIDRKDFVSLQNAIERMDQTLKGEYTFSPIEEQITFKLSMQKLGGVEIDGELAQEAGGWGHCLKFSIGSDQTMLKPTLKNLKQFIAAFDGN